MKKALMALAVVGLLGMVACGPAKPAVKTIGISMPTKSSARWIADGDNMVKEFQKLGYQADLQYAEDVVENQLSQVENMITKGDAALVIAAIDGESLSTVLQKAADAKIPVIAYDRLIKKTPNVDYYATFDNFQVGVLQASSIIVKSGQMGMDKVATLRWDGATAQARMDNLLTKNYSKDKVDAVLSPYDGISIGILSSLKAVGYGTPKQPYPIVTGQDCEIPSIKSIIAGAQTFSVFKDTRELAKKAVNMVDSVLNGKTPDVNDTKTYNNGVKIVPSFLLTPVSVDKNNYKAILVDSGYYTADQLAN